jgi:HJR/Mrr/RecB family endonuclease
MSGVEFEKLIAKRLQDDGWTTRLTRRTGDQGLDLFAFDEEFRVAIQCKRYTEPVSNGAVQEVHAAADVLKATHAVVIVSSRYTDSAIALATTLGVILLTIDQLHELRSHLVFMQPRPVRLRAPRLFLDT